jgi:hypothetical protein
MDVAKAGLEHNGPGAVKSLVLAHAWGAGDRPNMVMMSKILHTLVYPRGCQVTA